MTKRPKLYWNRWREGHLIEGGVPRRVAVIDWSYSLDKYVARERPGGKELMPEACWGLLSDAKRAVERHLGMERGR